MYLTSPEVEIIKDPYSAGCISMYKCHSCMLVFTPTVTYCRDDKCRGEVAYSLETVQKYIQKRVVDQSVLPGVTV